MLSDVPLSEEMISRKKGVSIFSFAFVRAFLRVLAFECVYLRFRSLFREPEICVCTPSFAFVKTPSYYTPFCGILSEEMIKSRFGKPN